MFHDKYLQLRSGAILEINYSFEDKGVLTFPRLRKRSSVGNGQIYHIQKNGEEDLIWAVDSLMTESLR